MYCKDSFKIEKNYKWLLNFITFVLYPNDKIMEKKTYQTPKNESMPVGEPEAAYRVKVSSSNNWNPNVPFHGTQEEWWEHIRRIEAGNFMTLAEFDHKFETWKKQYLANKLR